MAAKKKQIKLGSKTGNHRRRSRPPFSEVLKLADARARASVNRPSNRRALKSVRAAIAGTIEIEESPGMALRMGRWLLGLMLLPFCGVTSWTFFSLFSDVTLRHEFWQTTAFWYFATGGLLMTGWFATGLLGDFFLYLYVLGHELTHIVFIWMFRGTVSDWGVSVDGGYVTTDKSNIVIALAPYFVPLWAALVVAGFAAVGYFIELPGAAMKSLFGLLGFFWAFHLLWTLWMIPRDQPDLRENGTFLSLTIIYLANLLILVALMCLASDDMSFRGFAREWLANAREAGEGVEMMLRRLLR
ncbi:hypothetical protein ACFQY0_10955 [Haloferula chungangensis]|uniref:DUF3267 domain-containing protein n=1 Tax=Haloferula chungangensis TaxID=1048331 RepID=A0ABW2L8D2_9BACT